MVRVLLTMLDIRHSQQPFCYVGLAEQIQGDDGLATVARPHQDAKLTLDRQSNTAGMMCHSAS